MYTQFDVVTLVALLVFITISMIKGGIKSILGIAKWYGAFIIALVFYPYTKSIVEEIMQPSPIVNGIAVFLVYIFALVVLSIIIGILLAALGSTVGGVFDRILGAFVGLGIGYVLVSTVHFSLDIVYNGNDPEWLKNGKTYEFTKYGADMLGGYFNERFSSMTDDLGIDIPNIDQANIPDVVKSGEFQTGSGGLDVDELIKKAKQLKELGYGPEEVKSILSGQGDLEEILKKSSESSKND